MGLMASIESSRDPLHSATACRTMLKRLHHIGIAVTDLEATVEFYRETFGIESWERISLPERHMNVAVCCIGETMLEFIAPTSDEAAFAKFLSERGQGVHHLAYEVEALDPALRSLGAAGIRLIDAHGRPGIHDTCVAFLHPKSTHGVLIELVQPRGHDSHE
jgi:methylmalonyl-CoA/ethylmalonyl-CoA epimerase